MQEFKAKYRCKTTCSVRWFQFKAAGDCITPQTPQWEGQAMAGKKGKKWQLGKFDILQQLKRNEEGSIWKGDRGIYVIRHLDGKKGKKSPIANVILNNEFLTGLFKTRNSAFYAGDMKEGGAKKFLLFKVVDSGTMEVKVSL